MRRTVFYRERELNYVPSMIHPNPQISALYGLKDSPSNSSLDLYEYIVEKYKVIRTIYLRRGGYEMEYLQEPYSKWFQ